MKQNIETVVMALILSGALFFISTLLVFAKETYPIEPVAQCKQYAQEDDVAADSFAEYMQLCIASFELDPLHGEENPDKKLELPDDELSYE